MPILVLNGGSSSLKFSVYPRGEAPVPIVEGEAEDIGADATLWTRQAGGAKHRCSIVAHSLPEALTVALDALGGEATARLDAIGYRVVHPGPNITGHQRITPDLLRAMDAAAAFAPLHDPPTLEIVRLGMERFPDSPHFACFDTEFHRTMPPEAATYALPEDIRERGVRRYGFHGLSCESIVAQLAERGAVPQRLAVAHLGSGCSVTTLRDGRSLDNTMGLTPDGGVVMGTRPGDLDPGVVLYLLRDAAKSHAASNAADSVEKLLNQSAGLVALSGQANDMRAMRQAAEGGAAAARLAIAVFTHSIRKALGAACFTLGGLDALVFTGGIGEHNAATRAEVLAGLAPLGIALDAARNTTPAGEHETVRDVTASTPALTHTPSTRILVLPSQEDRMIARHVDRLLNIGP